MVLREGMTVVAIGAVIGVLLAAAAGRVLSIVLFVGALDPLSFGLALAILTGVAAPANWVPANRASRVDPMVALTAPRCVVGPGPSPVQANSRCAPTSAFISLLSRRWWTFTSSMVHSKDAIRSVTFSIPRTRRSRSA